MIEFIGAISEKDLAKADKDTIAMIKSHALVRCRDCKWCEERYDSIDKAVYWMCKNWDGHTDADGFCHEAERRTDGTD